MGALVQQIEKLEPEIDSFLRKYKMRTKTQGNNRLQQHSNEMCANNRYARQLTRGLSTMRAEIKALMALSSTADQLEPDDPQSTVAHTVDDADLQCELSKMTPAREDGELGRSKTC